MERRTGWYLSHRLWLELFVLVNLAFLAPDIYLAHSENLFRDRAECIPLVFSLVAPFMLLPGLFALPLGSGLAWWRRLGLLVGWASVAVGVAGLIWHLGSRFFYENTTESLVYTAPFAAPLAYTGLGLLLIMNRLVSPESVEWPLWVLLLALGGFAGNFIFSVADHAQNGFFHATEWIPVAASAFAVGFLLAPFLVRVGRPYVLLCAAVMLAQAAVGLLGCCYHTSANIRGPSPSRFDNFVYGAPAMAPLLFPNLALLALVGLGVLWPHLPAEIAAGTADRAGESLRNYPRTGVKPLKNKGFRAFSDSF
jgi:hypothetical protein